MKSHPAQVNGFSLVIGGEAGQGLQTVGQILGRMSAAAGLHVFAVNEFMSRIRGGSNSLTVRIADQPVRAVDATVDLCLLLDAGAWPRLAGRCRPDTVIFGDPDVFKDVEGLSPLPFDALARKAGSPLLAGSVLCGLISRVAGLESDPLEDALEQTFSDRTLLAQNLTAARLGRETGHDLPSFRLASNRRHRETILADGSLAVALGALAGGCNFISSYPMSPSTGVLLHLARLARPHGVVAEQAEDEISAINMALGSWYAGGRALVSTSGGGFDLMTEGLSLAGVIESPLVIHLAQRPGPGTGLPTRSEQGDLEIARYSGHGEFPRALLAPGTPEEAFALAARAFAMADAAQSPVILLTDQYLLDALCDLAPFAIPDAVPMQIVETTPNYRRYAESPNGVSPRGIPGYGRGHVCVDSDEHDAEGRITEDFALRTRMVDKRLQKETLLAGEWAVSPQLYGPVDYERLIVGWGSTAPVICEALSRVAPPQTAFLQMLQLWPLPPAVADYLARASRIIVVENNATGQLARLLRAETGCSVAASWLRYDGLPMTVDQIAAWLETEVRR